MESTTERKRELREALRANGEQAERIKSELDQIQLADDLDALRQLRGLLPIRVIDLLAPWHTQDNKYERLLRGGDGIGGPCHDGEPTGGLKINRDGKPWFRCLRCALLDINAGRLPAAQKGGN
jgi:hypothetical protein